MAKFPALQKFIIQVSNFWTMMHSCTHKQNITSQQVIWVDMIILNTIIQMMTKFQSSLFNQVCCSNKLVARGRLWSKSGGYKK